MYRERLSGTAPESGFPTEAPAPRGGALLSPRLQEAVSHVLVVRRVAAAGLRVVVLDRGVESAAFPGAELEVTDQAIFQNTISPQTILLQLKCQRQGVSTLGSGSRHQARNRGAALAGVAPGLQCRPAD